MKVLFICTGNTCRSVMAEFMVKKLAQEKGLDWEAGSCGLAAERYFQIPPGVRKALKAVGVEAVSHVPQLATRELLAWADLALAMTQGHREALAGEFPEFERKLHVLRAYAGLPDPDIEDPIGQPDPVYAACRDRIREALEALIAREQKAEAKEGK